MPIVIDFLSNVRKFVTGVDDVEDALSKVSSALDDVSDDARRSADKMADEYQGAAREVDQSTERLERTFKELADKARDESARGGAATRKNYSQAMKFGAAEVRAELAANMAETFSSFNGDITSFADGIQGTFGGLIASIGPLLGPAGILAAVAGAAGIGIIVSALQGGQKETEEFRKRVSDLTSELIDASGQGKRSFSGMADSARDLATETDSSKANLEKLEQLAKNLGLGLDDVAAAYLRGGGELDDLIAQTQKLLDTEQKRAAELAKSDPNKVYQGLTDGGVQYEQQLRDQIALMEKQNSAIKEAQEAELRYLRAGVSDFEVKKGLIESVNKAYDEAAGSIDTYVNAETGVFDVEAYIIAMQARQQALRDYQGTLASTTLSPEARAFLNEQGADAAASFLAGYVAAAPEQQAELDRIWSEAGANDSGTYAEKLRTGMRGIPKIPAPEVTLEDPDVDSYAASIQRQLDNKTITVAVDLVAGRGMRVF